MILFIGDGMGQTAVTAGRVYTNQRDRDEYTNRPLSFEQFETTAIVKVGRAIKESEGWNRHIHWMNM